MFDFQFDWDESIEVGIEDIDEQHQRLFRIGRDLEQLILTDCKAADGRQILDMLCAIREYMTYHFYTEEKILKETNHPEYESHRQQHENFKKTINAVDYEKLLENPTQELNKIRVYLQEWLFDHILHEDKKCFTVKK